MRKIHLAIATDEIDKTVADYTARLGSKPCLVIPGEYALWRTESINFSVRMDSSCAPGTLRHLGWEDSGAEQFSVETDVNGIVWENFTAKQQADEIELAWPGTGFLPK